MARVSRCATTENAFRPRRSQWRGAQRDEDRRARDLLRAGPHGENAARATEGRAKCWSKKVVLVLTFKAPTWVVAPVTGSGRIGSSRAWRVLGRIRISTKVDGC